MSRPHHRSERCLLVVLTNLQTRCEDVSKQRFAQQHSEQSQQLSTAVGGDGGVASWAEKFMRFNLPQFKGSSTPEEVEFWVRDIEQLFRLLECPDRERVVLATHFLRGVAGDWWRLMEETTLRGRAVRDIT